MCLLAFTHGMQVVGKLADAGVKVIAMRCAGFDRVDLEAARRHGIDVVRVPTYSPRTVAEHAMALAYALARELKHQMQRMAAGNYTLNGVVGTQLSYKTYGVMGTGNIGIEASAPAPARARTRMLCCVGPGLVVCPMRASMLPLPPSVFLLRADDQAAACL